MVDRQETPIEPRADKASEGVGGEVPAKKTHEIVVPDQKPSTSEADALTKAYFDEQAADYDSEDSRVERREKYTALINRLIAEDLKQSADVKRIIACACGTGRREEEIKKLTGREVEFVGVDLSEGMCQQARSRGMEAHCGSVTDPLVRRLGKFDAATFLYAMGHLSSKKQRLHALKNIGEALEDNGVLYLDVFNIDEEAIKGKLDEIYKKAVEQDPNYKKGDLMVQKLGSEAMGFMHYFDLKEIKSLLKYAGFVVEDIKYVGYWTQPGEILEGPNQGMMFIKARKKPA